MVNKFMVSISLLMLVLCKGYSLIVIASVDKDTICAGTTVQLQASAVGGSGTYTYSWSSNPPGFTSESPIPPATPFYSTWYIVTVTDNITNTGKDSVLVTVFTVPGQPGYITGPTELCKDSIGYYSVVEAEGATSYLWTVPPDASVINGQYTSVVTIQFGSIPGTISVVGVNNCGNSVPDSITVYLYFPPAQPGAISGPSSMCKYGTAEFSVNNVSGAASYQWTVPPDADILNGQGFKSVTVHWGETTGDISVIGNNFCGNGLPSSKEVLLEIVPDSAGTITGKEDPCKGRNGYLYSIDSIAGATSYIWTVPVGATIIGSQNGKQITVDFTLDAFPGDITVKGLNACDTGKISAKQLVLNDCSGISENGREHPFSVYPNPANQIVNIAFGKPFTHFDLFFTDINGRVISSETLLNIQTGSVKQKDISKYEKGIYFIKLVYDDRVVIEKMIIQ